MEIKLGIRNIQVTKRSFDAFKIPGETQYYDEKLKQI